MPKNLKINKKGLRALDDFLLDCPVITADEREYIMEIIFKNMKNSKKIKKVV